MRSDCAGFSSIVDSGKSWLWYCRLFEYSVLEIESLKSRPLHVGVDVMEKRTQVPNEKSNLPSNLPSWLKWVVGGKLLVIALIFISESGSVRLGESGLFAAGEETSQAPAPGAQDATKSGDGVRKGFLDDLLELPDLDTAKLKKEDVARYLSMADRKKRQIDERISMLGKRERQLKQLEKSIDEKLKRLDDERKFFTQSIQQEKDLQGQRLDKLVLLYDKMEPKKAAPVF